ncbi:MAG: ribose-phosphate diphosphokinase [Erysipelotrichia bacterium]|jgi:ribose-phosphate pyrophosphokinase|nr:ribose-phosphate diphosphokinase [Bacilli bacterium]MDD4005852.1 ribose-phosphate diphosphokinase [Bacilli bacterium]NMV81988.1 ribose-phosphate diphosphokinase [Erysipelotrichia bacterium]
MLEKIILFNLSSNPELVRKIANLLRLSVGHVELMHFSDGEVMARSLDSVRGKSVYIIQSTCSPASERLMELLVFIDGIKKASAKDINVIIPYYGYSRQDRIARPREPISARLVADLLQTVGVSHLITVDLHTPQIQGFFSCPVDNLSTIHLFAKYYTKKLKQLKIDPSEVVVVSPDHGSAHRGRDLATALPNSQLAIVDKRRPSPNEAEVVNIVGDVQGKTCIIIDDIIDTGGTIVASANELYAKGAREILVAASHGVFSRNNVEAMKNAGISDIVVTDSIEKSIPGVNVITISEVLSHVITHNESGTSLPPEYLAFY